MMNSSDLGVSQKSKRLADRRIAFGVCGGIGAVEVVKIVRELRRHGAEVTIFTTPTVSQFVGEMSLAWAAQSAVRSAPSAEVYHLETFDIAIVAPATLNTISKAALGLADNAVTLLIASQLGRKAPLLFIPAMNVQLREHPAYGENVSRLTSWGARFIEPPIEEGRLKMPAPETFVDEVEKVLRPK